MIVSLSRVLLNRAARIDRLPVSAAIAIAITFYGFGTTVLSEAADVAEGASVVTYYGYDDCIRLENETTTVTLCPAAGGRVLQYAIGGENVLYLPSGNEGWLYAEGKKGGKMHAGRFDFGPEKMVRHSNELWMGRWAAKITGPRSARLTSQVDDVNGVRLIRDFVLDADSSYLRCRQTIENVSDRDVSYCHWSRTFAIGGGIAVVPRSDRGRFPKGYVLYEPGNKIQFDPDDSNVLVTDQMVVVSGPPQYPKLGFDSYEGWIAYYAPSDQLFIKRYSAFRDRAYNEVAGLTASVWYPQSDMVELEPIGPAENLAPGQSASFDEHWWLLDATFPRDAGAIDAAGLRTTLEQLHP
tara:strand:+ start:235884 stop:236942 length:1059 start_codon:yes stop_codon:yes gene_type:complete